MSGVTKEPTGKTSFGRVFGLTLAACSVLTVLVGLFSFVVALFAENGAMAIGASTTLVTLGLGQGAVAGAGYTIGKAVGK